MKILKNQYKICRTVADVKRLIKYCKQTRIASVDFETTGLKYHSESEYPTILGVSFQVGSSYIIPLGHFDSPFRDNWVEILQLFGREVIMNPNIIKIAQNLKFEYKWFKRFGINMEGILEDPMLAMFLLDENLKVDLKSMVDMLIPEFGGYEDEIDDWVMGRKDKNHKGWENVPLEPLSKYCGQDTDFTLRLMCQFQTRLIQKGFYNLFRNLHMMLSRVLGESEFVGMRVNRDYLDRIIEDYGIKIQEVKEKLLKHPRVRKFQQSMRKAHVKKLIDAVREEIEWIENDLAEKTDKKKGTVKGKKLPKALRKTREQKNKLISSRQEKIRKYLSGNLTTKKEVYEGFNLSSPQQMAQFFFLSKKGLNLPDPKLNFKKKERDARQKGKEFKYTPSTDEATILWLQENDYDKSGFLTQLLELRGLEKLYSTNMVGMRDVLDINGYIHCNYRITGTVTGRYSSNEPNMQNIPRITTNADVKPMFEPPSGYLHHEADYSQAELRVVAELAQDKNMIDIFRRGYNIHVATACIVNGVLDRYDEIRAIIKNENHPDNLKWEKEKKKAKTINFGILYGQGPDKLAQGMKVTVKEAEEFTKKWFAAYPQVKKWIRDQKKFCQEHGYVYTIWGNKRRLPDIWSDQYGKFLEAERQAVNSPIQGAAAYFTNFSTVVLREMRLKGELPATMIQRYTVHDSIGYYLKPEEVEWVNPIVIKTGKNPQTLEYFGFEMKYVEMKLSSEAGPNWGNLKEL